MHCQIVPENGRYLVVDFDSAGGTFVNGKQVNRNELQAGDPIRLSLDAAHLHLFDASGKAHHGG